jgi:hypothetical protein
MTLPNVTEFGRFERFNGRMCSVTFAADISPEKQRQLKALTEGHNRATPGGPEKPRYFLVFKGNLIEFWRTPGTEAPTKAQFGELLQELSITDPREAEPQPQPTAVTLPKTTDDAHRAA